MIQLLGLVFLLALAVCFVIAAIGLTVALVVVARRRRSGRPYALALVLGIVACLPFLAMAGVVALGVGLYQGQERSNMGPLLSAIDRNQVAAVRRQLRDGADVNEVNIAYQNMTPLFFAVQKRRPEIVALLVESRADVNKPAGYYWHPPLFAAIENDDRAAVDYLLRHGADPNRRGSNYTGLVYAAYHGHDPGVVELLLKHGGGPNQTYYHDSTPLHIVVRRGSFDGPPETFDERLRFATMLIDHGASLAAKDDAGKTALDWARELGRADIVEYAGKRAARDAGAGD